MDIEVVYEFNRWSDRQKESVKLDIKGSSYFFRTHAIYGGTYVREQLDNGEVNFRRWEHSSRDPVDMNTQDWSLEMKELFEKLPYKVRRVLNL